jgi:hypothetical protein
MLISLTSDDELANKAQDDADDLIFTDENQNVLNHEIEEYDSSSGKLIAWVNVTFLSSIEDTSIYIYYGNSTCGSQQSVFETWGSHYRMVQHLNEITGIHSDSTLYGNNGMYFGNTQDVSGFIDGADQFIGNFGASGGDYIDCGNDSSLNINDAITVSAWIKPDDQTQWNHICTKGNGDWGTDPNRVYQLSIETNESIDFIINSDQVNAKATTSYHVPIGSWSYIVGTYDRNAIRVYVDGEEKAVHSPYTSLINNNSVHLRIAARVIDAYNEGTPAFAFDGIIDEVRVSDCARSNAWIAAEFNNQHNPDNFYTIGLEEIASYTNWETTLHFTTTSRIYDFVVFGEKNNASDGIDSYDVPKSPPAIPPYLYIMFSTNFSEPYHMLWYEYKHCPGVYKIWNLNVQWVPSDYVSSTNVTIVWNNSLFNESEYTSILLHNIETDEIVDMLNVNSYMFTASALNLHPFRIICRALIKITDPVKEWNFISVPFNQSIYKTNFVLGYEGQLLNWSNATSSGLVLNSVTGWNRTNQNYYLVDVLLPGEGYWMYFYENCELFYQGIIREDSSERITWLFPTWNIIGLPYSSILPKEELLVKYNEVVYNWTQATTSDNPTGSPLILKFIYNWNKSVQNYVIANSLTPGEGHWLFSFQNCVLLKDIN